jgi:hypothetical protein
MQLGRGTFDLSWTFEHNVTPMHIFTEETVKQKPHIPIKYLIHKRE